MCAQLPSGPAGTGEPGLPWPLGPPAFFLGFASESSARRFNNDAHIERIAMYAFMAAAARAQRSSRWGGDFKNSFEMALTRWPPHGVSLSWKAGQACPAEA